MLVLRCLHPLAVRQLLTLPGIQGIQGCIFTRLALQAGQVTGQQGELRWERQHDGTAGNAG